MDSSGAHQVVDSRISRRYFIGAIVLVAGAGKARSGVAEAMDNSISKNAEAIHQEPVFNAGTKRIYQVLTESGQFDELIAFSAAAKSMSVKSEPARIEAHSGGAFRLFGGYISGRFVELVPEQLIVQAWRAGSWDPGVYSIARFELRARGTTQTRILFDHLGFPGGQAEHLAQGWHVNYWEPLARLLAT